MNPSKMLVTLYSKPECHLCEDTRRHLDKLTSRYKLEVREVNILDDPALLETYGEKIPVVVAGDGRLGRLVAPIGERELRGYLEMVQAGMSPEVDEPSEFWVDRFVSHIGRHWLKMINWSMGIFVGLPWIAPIFAALGLWAVANPIYVAYAITCHQLPERAGEVFGYQVAFCFRNSSIYGGFLLFGLLYGLARDRNVSWLQWLRRPIPWWIFGIMLLPALVDGITHIAGLRDGLALTMDSTGMPNPTEFDNFMVGSQAFGLNWWIRVFTGLLAALGAVWFGYPRINRSVQESEELRLAYQREARRRYAAASSV